MAAFLYRCPATGFQVQDWVHDDEPDDGRETYEGVHCPACQRLHFAGWRKMVARLGVAAKLGFKAHPHMFRHACGFQLANQGTDTRTLQAYLGHRNIQHTVRYTELSPTRFKNLWRD